MTKVSYYRLYLCIMQMSLNVLAVNIISCFFCFKIERMYHFYSRLWKKWAYCTSTRCLDVCIDICIQESSSKWYTYFNTRHINGMLFQYTTVWQRLRYLDEPLFFLAHLVSSGSIHHGLVRVQSSVRSLIFLREVLALVARHVATNQHRHHQQSKEDYRENTYGKGI